MGNEMTGSSLHDPLTTKTLVTLRCKALMHSKEVENYNHYNVIKRYRGFLYHDCDVFIYRPSLSELAMMAKTIEACRSLDHLNLSNLNMDDDMFVYFMSFIRPERATFRKFTLSHNNLSDKAMLCLSSYMERNTALVAVDLSYNAITDKGFGILADTLKDHHKIESFRIDHNDQTEQGIRWMLRALFFNHYIIDFSIGVQSQAEIAYQHMFLCRNKKLRSP